MKQSRAPVEGAAAPAFRSPSAPLAPLTLRYSEALARRAVRAFWLRVTGWRFLLAFLLSSVSLACELALGDRSWVVGALGAAVALVVLFSAALYLVHDRGSLGRLRRMRSPEATLEAGHDRFSLSSDVGRSELGWGAVTEVGCFPEFWLFFLSRAQFFTVPTADLDPAAGAFLLERVRAHGGKVG